MWAPGSSLLTDQEDSTAIQSIGTLQKLQKPLDAKKLTTSLINSKKSNSQSTTKPEIKKISPKTLTELEEDLDKLLDDTKPKTQLDKYLTESHPTTDSLPIEDYMGRWCNFIQVPSSLTPQESHHMPQLISPEE